MPSANTQPIPSRGENQTSTPARQRRTVAARDVLLHDDAYATTLLVLFVDRYGTGGLSWAPQTIRLQLDEDYNCEVPRQNFDRLMAAIHLITSDDFYKRLPVFNQLCNVLSGDDFNPTVFEPASVADCAWGITEALLLSPPEEDEPFTEEIRYYVGALLRNEGYTRAPDVLRIALGNEATSQISADWADDPDMATALYQSQNAKTSDVEEMIRENLSELLTQLESLPVENGSVEGLKARLGRDLAATAQTAA